MLQIAEYHNKMLLFCYTGLPDKLTLICAFVWSIAVLGHNLTTLVARIQFWYILMNLFQLKCMSLSLLDPRSWNKRDYNITDYIVCHCWSHPPVRQHTISNVLTQPARLWIWAKVMDFIVYTYLQLITFFRDQIFRQVNDIFWTINIRMLSIDRISKQALISVLFLCFFEAL